MIMEYPRLRFALFGNIYQTKKSASIQKVLSCLSEHRAEVLVDREYYDFLTADQRIDVNASRIFEDADFDADFVISMGGDGTFLKAASRVREKMIPILGVNMGRLGFLADVSPSEIEQCMEALRTGCFTYFAHPDVWYFTGDPAVYDAWIRRLCGEAKRLDIPLEINFLGISDHRHYPNEAFWKIAGETGNKVVFGCDAHSPGMIGNPQAYTIASQIAQRNHLEVLETVELIDPFGTENRSPVPAKAGQRTVPCPGQNRRNARYE